MREYIFNLYYFATDNLITHVAAVIYTHSGTDEQKRKYLLSKVGTDLSIAKYGDIPTILKDKENGISIERINSLMRLDNLTYIFSDLLKGYDENSFFVITPIQNGNINYQFRLEDEPLRQHHIDKFLGLDSLSNNDYLTKYYVNEKFNLTQLLFDDHFVPIHLLFNHGHYIASIKLLLSFIDTIAWIDIGEHHNFIKWVNLYADLTTLGITAGELWELRNSLLHMSNLNNFAK
ncbi:hypothetical protein [Pectobacterium aquaticum]|uniref:hypothetical protein n=1 Tax=Pectobacterium aquaticum TaxID=2204145 RepID=UPI000E257892|nr:hypothetical protein [Pectobacterium aquaticum]UEM40613.1 hypothetical protein DMB82_0006425 [Pectobacterium aquaticum]